MQVHISPVFSVPDAIIFWIVFVWAFIPEFRLIRESLRSPPSLQDAGTLHIIKIGNQVTMFIGLATSFLPWFQIPYPRVVLMIGTVLLLVGSILRRICFRALGKYFTGAVIVNVDQPVIDQGPYRWVRHPSYTAGFLSSLGVGIALGTWISVVVFLVTSCFVYTRRVRAEEKALLITIGKPYRAYMLRTKRFIPFIF